MANSQIYPQSTYPLTGDIASTPGVPDVRVTGIQKTPVIDQAPQDGQILIFDQPTNQYVPGDPIVSGPNAVGTPSTRPPVQVGGTDSVVVRELLLDTQGALVVSPLAGLGEQIQILIQEIRALKAAVISLDNTLVAQDFDAENYADGA